MLVRTVVSRPAATHTHALVPLRRVLRHALRHEMRDEIVADARPRMLELGACLFFLRGLVASHRSRSLRDSSRDERFGHGEFRDRERRGGRVGSLVYETGIVVAKSTDTSSDGTGTRRTTVERVQVQASAPMPHGVHATLRRTGVPEQMVRSEDA
jgi:hypothetical protein